MASWRYSSKYGRLVPLTKAGLQKLQATGSLEIPGTPRTKSSKGWSRKRDFNEVDLADSNHWNNMKAHNSDRRPFALARAKRRHERGLREI